MRKNILLLLVCFCVSLSGFSEELKFEVKHNGTVLTDGETVEVRTVETFGEKQVMRFRVDVTNTSGSTIRMNMKKNVENVQANTSNTICWAVCMEPEDLSVPSFEDFTAGTTQPAYTELELNADGEPIEGTSVIEYTFKTTIKGDKSLRVIVYYVYEKPEPDEPEEPVTPPTEPEDPVIPPVEPEEPVTPPTEPEDPVTPPTEPEEPVTPPAEPEDPVNPPTSMEQVSGTDTFVVYPGKGCLTFSVAEAQNAYVYKLNGTLVQVLVLPAGKTFLSGLERGVYIVNKQKVLVQ